MEDLFFRTWNELVYSKNIFPEEINQIQAKENSASVITAELKELLRKEGVLESIYENYKKLFDKEKEPTRQKGLDTVHKEVFKSALLNMAVHNVEARAGKHTWWMGVNQLTDMTDEELKMYNGFIPTPIETPENLDGKH